MGATLLSALSAFLLRVGDAPHPDEVAQALVDSFSEPFGARTSSILAIRGDLLVVLGRHGYDADEVSALRAMPLAGDHLLSQVVREGEVLIEPNADISGGFAAAKRPWGSWASTVARLPHGTTLGVPITSGGRAVGACALITEGPRPLQPLEVAALGAVGLALGMWLTHPDSGLPAEEESRTPSLTARQVAILELVADDCSNPEIGKLLGFSESTVKQELQRIQRTLGVSGRQQAVARATRLGLLVGRTV